MNPLACFNKLSNHSFIHSFNTVAYLCTLGPHQNAIQKNNTSIREAKKSNTDRTATFIIQQIEK